MNKAIILKDLFVFLFFVLQCPDQDIKLLHNRILLYRYQLSSYHVILPLNPKDILMPDTIVEVIISRKLRTKQKARSNQVNNP